MHTPVLRRALVTFGDPLEAIDAIDSINGTGSLLPEELFEEARLGFEELRRMSHVELRGVIADRVALLEGILREREERREATLERMIARTQTALDRIAECRASEDCPADDDKLAALEERLENRLAKLEACSSGEDECDMPKRPHGRHPYLKERLRERLQRA